MGDIFDDMNKLQKDMNKVFSNLSKRFENIFKFKEPSTEISQNNKELRVELYLPGISKKDIFLKIKNNLLEVRAEKRKKTESRKAAGYKKESSFNGFYRALSLPADIVAEKAKAEFKKEKLIIKIPKSKKNQIENSKIKIV